MSRLSFAGRDPELSQHTPVSLRKLRALRSPFGHARDPYLSAQLSDREKTKAQRREEHGRGSHMVKLHKPFPELKPKDNDNPLRAAFNRAWLKEQRAAQLARFKKERQHREQQTEALQPGVPHIVQGRER